MNNSVVETTVDKISAFVWESATVTLNVYPTITRDGDAFVWGTCWELQGFAIGKTTAFTLINNPCDLGDIRVRGRLIIEGWDMNTVLSARGDELAVLVSDLQDSIFGSFAFGERTSGTKNLRPSVLANIEHAFTPSEYSENYWFDMNGSNN